MTELWRTYRRQSTAFQVGVGLFAIGWLAQVTLSIVILITLL